MITNGKLVLASWPEDRLAAFLRQSHRKFTATTITDPADLRREIEDVKRLRYGVSRSELEDGFNGLSAAVVDSRGRQVATVSVSGPVYRLSQERLKALAPRVIETAEEIGRRLL